MLIDRRTVLAALIGLAIWGFFFVPNGAFHMFNVQGLGEHIPLFALFGAIPFALGCLLSAMLDRRPVATAAVTVGVPVLGIGACLLLWASGYYSDESLLGAWLILFPPLPAYIGGALLGLWLRTRLRFNAAS